MSTPEREPSRGDFSRSSRPPRNSPKGEATGRSDVSARQGARSLALFALVCGIYALHQDFWNWQRIDPLLFGLLPAGLWYHLAYSIVATLMMALLVRFAWPTHLEVHETKEPPDLDHRREDES